MLRGARYIFAALLTVSAGCTRDPVAQSRQMVENGKRFVAKGKYKQASIMFRRALQKDAKNGDAYYQLGLVSLKMQAWPDAAAALRRAVSTQPNNEDAAVKLADLYWTAYAANQEGEKGILPELTDLVKSMLASNPKSFDGWRLQGYLNLAANKPAEALKNFETARQVKPHDPTLEFVYAQTLSASGRGADAEQVAKDSIAQNKTDARAYDFLVTSYVSQKRMADAEDLLKLMADANPKSEAPLVKLAIFYRVAGRRQDVEATLARITSRPADFPTGRLTSALFFARFREYDRARKELEEGIKADPKNKATYQKVEAQVLSMQGKGAEAANIVDGVLKEDPKDSQAIAMRAAMLVASGSPEKIRQAVSDLQNLVGKKPEDGQLRIQLAQALIANKQQDQARVHLEQAIKLLPRSAQPRVLLAQLISAKGEYSKALTLADEALVLDRSNYYARLIRATSLTALGKRDEARAELQTILKSVPASADAQFQLGYLSYQEQNFKEAEKIFANLQQNSPKDPRGVIGVVESQVALGNFQEAVKILRTEMERDPDRVEYREALGNVYVRSKQYDEGLKEFQAIAAKRSSPEILIKLGEVYRLKGDVNNAVDYFQRAKVAAGSTSPAPALRLAMLLDGMQRRDEAKRAYEDVLRIEPDNGVAMNNLAFLKAEDGSDLDRALTLAQRARQRFPTDANVADTLGWIYVKKNLNDDAIRLYRDILSKAPNNPTYRYHFAMALVQKGDKASARQELDTALKSGPTQQEQKSIRDLMARVGS